MKHTKKRVAALLLTLAMVLSLMPMAFAEDDAAGFPDMPAEEDASYAAVKSAVDNGLLTGEDGKLNLEGSMTRATMAAVITRAFGAKGEADMSAFSDADGHWATKSGELPAAVAMGIMNGSNGKMLPNDQVTLEQVITMLVRALGLPLGTADDLKDVAGADSVTAWAVPYVAALLKAGYDVPDLTGAAQPLSRVEFTEMMYQVSGGNYASEGEITEDVDGNIIITGPVSLKGITVKGDIIIADGVDADSIVLDNVKVEGRLVVRGGSDVSLTNGTTAASTVVAAPAGELTVKADDASDAGEIAITGTDSKAAEKVTVDMAEPKVTVEAGTTLAVQNAKGGEVTLKGDGAKVAVESGTVASVTVADGVKDVAVDVAADATIEKVTTNSDLTVTGEGTVTEKAGSGTVTDAEGNEVEGTDEPADVPTVTTPSTPTETDPNKPTNTPTHTTHNWVASNFDATRHLLTCTNKAESTEGAGDGITGCGAKSYANHTYGEDGECTAEGCTAKKPGTVKTEGTAGDAAEGKTKCGTEGAEHADHKWVPKAKEGDKAASCTEDGKKSYECEYCGSTKTDTLEKLEHSYTATATVAATCGAAGRITYTCSNCAAEATGHTKTVDTPATGQHDWVRDGYKEAGAPTCKATGFYHYKCKNCEETDDTKVAPKLTTHTWTDWAKKDDISCERHCSVCYVAASEGTEASGAQETKAHVKVNYTGTAADGKQPYQAPTCTTQGKTATVVCRDCGAVITASTAIETVAHKFSASWTSDASGHWHDCTTCAGDGKDLEGNSKADHDTTGVGGACSVCGYKASGTTTPTGPQGDHTWVEGKCTKASDGHGANICTCPNTRNHPDVSTIEKGADACATCHLKGTKEPQTNPPVEENS